MTIQDIVDKKETVRRTIDSMQSSDKDKSIGNAMSALDKKFEKAKDEDGKALMTALRNALYPVFHNEGEARKLLWDYDALLGSVMRETNVPWPPKCDAT